MKLLARLNFYHYPSQFRLMFWGMMLSTAGSSMIWPFLIIFVSEKLSLPLTAVTSLLTIQAISSVIASFLAGPVVDRFGRKWVMAGSLFLNGVAYLFISQAETLPVFAVLMAITGFVNPLYRVGADAMLADLVPEKERVDAYSLLRMGNNAGIAIGPAVGGFIASASYSVAFFLAAAGMIGYSLLLAFFAKETLPQLQPGVAKTAAPKEQWGGYLEILRNKSFMKFAGAFTMVMVCASFMWVLMPVYAKQNYGVPENQYGFIPTTNAIIVVTMQILMTRWTRKLNPLIAMAFGGALYTLGAFSVSFGSGFWWFWSSMVVMSVGELALIPTSSTYVANHAPPDKRGRYMSIYGLSHPLATGFGSLIGGILSDTFGPRTIWYGGSLIGFIGVLLFMWMARRTAQEQPAPVVM